MIENKAVWLNRDFHNVTGFSCVFEETEGELYCPEPATVLDLRVGGHAYCSRHAAKGVKANSKMLKAAKPTPKAAKPTSKAAKPTPKAGEVWRSDVTGELLLFRLYGSVLWAIGDKSEVQVPIALNADPSWFETLERVA